MFTSANEDQSKTSLSPYALHAARKRLPAAPLTIHLTEMTEKAERRQQRMRRARSVGQAASALSYGHGVRTDVRLPRGGERSGTDRRGRRASRWLNPSSSPSAGPLVG
ncbi:uncharacterized protein MCYG_00307 [Microsporum canis CBS 113480]|uniref:Uncharacterized protein n=1 Tax=Arthroderma otae (strain ATCC MYA-4605 / CBS 113480) TaxID=554155 RepID=C5FCH5_ARTOC|nr:uncharacterized protein MCYG_00307 [Microsporum canis CBS 113480]EEQ27419.1 predicted protein [Microsporum canis CBS 113480]